LSPAELSPPKQPPNEDPVSPENGSPGKWILTKAALDKLLERFSPDSEEAARKYLVMQSKLTRFFEWQSSPSPEDEAYTTMTRVARKIAEGADIHNLPGYFRKVAHNVFMESLRPERTVALDDVPDIPDEQPVEDDYKEVRLRCLDECLDLQSDENRQLILGYYRDVRRAKIEHRRQLAEESTMNALRIRACRIRKGLEKCVRDCVNQVNSK
jgi:DNA-directed RNA polymerase specialized sigma24 family protein